MKAQVIVNLRFCFVFQHCRIRWHKSKARSLPRQTLTFLSAAGHGIVKTRWGLELFRALENGWTPPHVWTSRLQTSLHLDFANGVRVDDYDRNLPHGRYLAYNRFYISTAKVLFLTLEG